MQGITILSPRAGSTGGRVRTRTIGRRHLQAKDRPRARRRRSGRIVCAAASGERLLRRVRGRPATGSRRSAPGAGRASAGGYAARALRACRFDATIASWRYESVDRRAGVKSRAAARRKLFGAGARRPGGAATSMRSYLCCSARRGSSSAASTRRSRSLLSRRVHRFFRSQPELARRVPSPRRDLGRPTTRARCERPRRLLVAGLGVAGRTLAVIDDVITTVRASKSWRGR